MVLGGRLSGMNPPPAEAAEDEPDSPATGLVSDQVKVDRRRLDEVFGDVLPDTSSDERDTDPFGGQYSDQWFLENRPPHHGG